uniref:Ankyrin repeat and MYND domain-containing protein 2 n=1 Tax=Aceria tosichella TaxID=561515 RepID=A0A6G1SQD5_9ACAR
MSDQGGGGDKSAEPAANNTAQRKLFEALAKKDLATVKQIVRDEPNLNLNCIDQDELSPLQHACHIGDVELARLLINNGADVNYTQRKDRYTALMFAAISAKADIVRLLLERGVDTTAENCVNRTAADMAAFVGQSKIVSIINCWIPYAKSIEPYTRKRELEDVPRLPSKQLGHILHNYIVYPTFHPVKFMLFIKENLELVQFGPQVLYVLDDLCTKATKPPVNDETLSLKYHYLSYVLQYCITAFETKKTKASNEDGSFDKETCEKAIEMAIRRLIRQDDPDKAQRITQLIDRFIIDCIFKFPYTQSAIFKTATYALTKLDRDNLIAYGVLIQVLNGPRMFGIQPEACAVCREAKGGKKCSRCKSVFYCDQSCQKADWFQHKKCCKSDG